MLKKDLMKIREYKKIMKLLYYKNNLSVADFLTVLNKSSSTVNEKLNNLLSRGLVTKTKIKTTYYWNITSLGKENLKKYEIEKS